MQYVSIILILYLLKINNRAKTLKNNNQMSQRTLNGTIALDRLITVMMTKKNKEGKSIEGIFIPLEINKLEKVSYEAQGGMVNEIQLPIRVIVKETSDAKGQDGFISKAIGSKTYKAATSAEQQLFKDYTNEETKKLTPILGNLKDFSGGGAKANNSQIASAEMVDADEDDLPF